MAIGWGMELCQFYIYIMKFNDFKEEGVIVEKAELSTVIGGTSTTLILTVGHSENEYKDDGDGQLDPKKDKFIGILDL